jgi:hypothetical protein
VQYALLNSKWGQPTMATAGGKVPWSFVLVDWNHIGGRFVYDRQIAEIEYQNLVRDALDLWEKVANINFVEVADPTAAKLRFGWDAIDGARNTLADAFVLPKAATGVAPLNSIDSVDLRFDSAENWSTAKTLPAPGQSSFFTTALHEIGHAIGLSHSEADEVMGGMETGLSPLALAGGDITGAQTIYGPAFTTKTSADTLFVMNSTQAKALSATYHLLLGGVPNTEGFVYLITNNIDTNYGSKTVDTDKIITEIGPELNAESIFINVINSLYQGNAGAAARFDEITVGDTLSEKLSSIYQWLIPTASQSQAGLAFFSGEDQATFYSNRANELGLVGDVGAGVIAFASLLNIIVREDLAGIGDMTNDLYASVVNGISAIPNFGAVLTDIDVANGLTYDADNASNLVARFASRYFEGNEPSAEVISDPVSIVGLSDDAELQDFG